ncbi:MAG: 4a-hydroxytetrahydrobiopterin dehydratase [Solirubrobacteraceae bacterium]
MAKLSRHELQQRLQRSPWRLDGAEIVRDLQCADFDEAIELVNAVARLAQQADHHPDILIHGWNRVRLTLSTHSEGGLTDADLQLARRIDELA